MPFEIIEMKTAKLVDGVPVYRIRAVLDTAADLTGLGTGFAAGSRAKIAGGTCYIMNASGSWVEDALVNAEEKSW